MTPMSTITLAAYLADPCKVSSLPYWKTKAVIVPANMRILHDSEYREESNPVFTDTPYFRLIHRLDNLASLELPAGFSLCDAAMEEYSRHIASCYDSIRASESELKEYRNRPVYHPGLWLAVRADRTGTLAATAIGELDPEAGEGVLEWVQVSKEYRRMGLGKFLVLELLGRMKDSGAAFATVSGQCGNPSNPEALYRSCGFSGQDVWHILVKKG